MFICVQCDLYLEVSSRDYLVTSNTHIRLLFGSWFRNLPPKEQKLMGERFLKRNSFQVRAGPVKGQKQGRDEKTQKPYPSME